MRHPSNGLRGSSAHLCPQVGMKELHVLSTGQPGTVPCEFQPFCSAEPRPVSPATVQENYCLRSSCEERLLLQPTVGKDSSNISESILAVTARGRCRGDFHILAENGLKGFISVHHGTEHQGLVEKKWIGQGMDWEMSTL